MTVVEMGRPAEQKSLWDMNLYAPAIPGVLVALAALWIAHWLAGSRERKKGLAELCDALEALAEEAVKASNDGWTLRAGQKREQAVHMTRWRLQKVGAAATRLLNQSSGPMSSGINVITEAAHFRDALTADPFLDPRRRPDPAKVRANLVALATFMGRLNHLRDIVLA
jgi:hypothetical protein